MKGPAGLLLSMANSSIFELGDFFALDSPLTPPPAPAPVSVTLTLERVTAFSGTYSITYTLSPSGIGKRPVAVQVTLAYLGSPTVLARQAHALADQPVTYTLAVRAAQLTRPGGANINDLLFTLLATGPGFTASCGEFKVESEYDARQDYLAQRTVGGPQGVPSGRVDQASALTYHLPDLSAWRALLNNKVPPSTLKELEARNYPYEVASIKKGNLTPLLKKPFYIQTLDSGWGDINIDYYAVRITKKPLLDGQRASAEKFFQYMRGKINKVINETNGHFNWYTDADADRWKSSKPLNTIASIPLGGFEIPWKLISDDKALYDKYFRPRAYFRPDHGAVIASVYTPLYWRFTTIATPNDLEHAICGTREFGVQPEGEGYVFYVRGVDRPASLIDLVANKVAPRALMGGSFKIDDLANAIWDGADTLWRSMQQGVVDAVCKLQGEAIIVYDSHPANRYPWEAVKRKYIRP